MELIYILDKETGIKYYVKTMNNISQTKSATLTEYPTTEGTGITDHAYIEPNTVNFTLQTSEFNHHSQNVYYTGTANNTVEVDLNSIKNLIGEWYKNHTRLLVQTRLNQYDNMIITNISLTETNENRGEYNPTISLKECRIAHLYTELLGPFEGIEIKPVYSQEYNMGTSNGASWEGTLGAIAAGATVGGIIGGIFGSAVIGAVVGGAVGAFGYFVGWW